MLQLHKKLIYYQNIIFLMENNVCCSSFSKVKSLLRVVRPNNIFAAEETVKKFVYYLVEFIYP